MKRKKEDRMFSRNFWTDRMDGLESLKTEGQVVIDSKP